MQLPTTRFGVIEIDDGVVITFTQPIIGFPTCRRFVLMPGPPERDGRDSCVKWLQSVEAGEIAFLVMDPRLVYPNYEVDIRPDELAELAVSTVADLDVYTLVVVPADHTEVRTNLKAPILINRTHRLAKQSVLDRKDYPIQYFLVQAQRAARRPEEVAPPEAARR
jgi:flagellar assembly factor FliW